MFWRHSWDVCTLVPNNLKFCVCMSVFSLAYFITDCKCDNCLLVLVLLIVWDYITVIFGP